MSPLRSGKKPYRHVTNQHSPEEIAAYQTEDNGAQAEKNRPPPTKPRHAEPYVGTVGDPHCQKRTGGPENSPERRGAWNDRARNERREAKEGK